MYLSVYALAAVFGSVLAVPSSVTTRPRVCGSVLSDEKVAEMEAHFAKNRVSPNSSLRAAATISVHWHVISSGSSVSSGNIPDSQISSEISVLNKAYTGSGVSFTLASTDRTVNRDWFDNALPDSSQQTAMKNALRIGGAADLNIYSTGFTNDDQGLLGYSTFPQDFASNNKDDGVVFLFSSIVGGTLQGFNLGHTVTHEVGHWVGLFHTFQGGCSSSGDSISDTPAEASPASGCPTGRNTCSSAGVDPIHNYMDYSDDACMTQFTPGQWTRLQDQLATFRGI